ncbi:LuxR C-terminal-related transcriptional regulator [Paenibacillus lautus]|uniref:LuxR C-terminal-related transcriptional regulator n=1 Tax=Paenibacillus lautus TaxID=1401 RepID=UPI002DBACCC8|nr:LuxR C-terminal-related transcriptional regulator [Paenibacillus lautus]MEC0201539.1 LuxR C-terminal-related transcriptional regulator [Paenibacillus lautus]
MSTPILSTKLHIPSPRSKAVLRPRLIERLNEGLLLQRKLTTISASAGCGKTTLLSQWIEGSPLPVAWLSLEEADREPARFLAYLAAALQTIGIDIGEGVMSKLQTPSPLPLPIEAIVTAILNHIAVLPDRFILVLDDYHVMDSKPIDSALGFLIERMPPQMHVVIASRYDPDLPLARLRARDQLTEVRTSDLRFTSAETSEFMRHVMGLDLSAEDAALLESRTEGWIAGLQLAALSLQGHQDTATFIRSFGGKHRDVLDYLVEEVLQQQPEGIQDFLLYTSILDRLCGSLCEYVLRSEGRDSPLNAISGQETLEYLERVNLFIVPLDKERRWYRYHHLFSDALRQRLSRRGMSAAIGGEREVSELHRRASEWHERHDLLLEAFQHAIAAQDVDLAARLIEGEGMPLVFRGAIGPVLHWLDSLPKEELDARPALNVMHASAMLMVGQMTGIEPKLQAAEIHLYAAEDDYTRDLIGHIASIRATLAVSKHQPETIMAESRRALEFLNPHNLPVRTATIWTLGYAYQLQGDRAAAGKAYQEAVTISQKIGHIMIHMMATLGLGIIQEAENQLYVAAETYRRVLHLAGDPPLPAACEAHLGLARICREWNDLDAAEQHGLRALHLAGQFEQTDRAVACEVFLARLKLSRGAVNEAVAMLAKADHFARQHHFTHQLSHIAEAQVLAMLQQGNVRSASQLAQKFDLKLSQARVLLAQGDTAAALVILEHLRADMEVKGWADEQLKVKVLQALAIQAHGEKLKAAQIIADVLGMSEPGGFIRLFIDEGEPMRELLSAATVSKPKQKQLREVVDKPKQLPLIGAVSKPEQKLLWPIHDYLERLLHALEAEGQELGVTSVFVPRFVQPADSLIEPLSRREMEVLRLIADGLSNRQISERLFVTLSTVKGHNRMIFDKLQATRRTEAVARARELGLL